MITVQMNVAASTAAVPMTVSAQAASIAPVIGAEYRMVEVQQYDGPLTIIPSGSRQVLETAGMKLADNIVIDPVPQGYGRIEWNGSTLTVS